MSIHTPTDTEGVLRTYNVCSNTYIEKNESVTTYLHREMITLNQTEKRKYPVIGHRGETE